MATIVIVDDEETIRTTVQLILEEDGYNVVTFAQGTQALAYLRQQTAPCVVLTDYLMPEMMGDELLRRAHADLNTVPHRFIMFAARPQQQLSAEANEVLAQWNILYLMKPFEIDTLLDTVQAAIPT